MSILTQSQAFSRALVAPILHPRKSVQVCECPGVTVAGAVGVGWWRLVSLGCPPPERRTPSLATPRPGVAAALFCCSPCCRRIFLGTNDSATWISGTECGLSAFGGALGRIHLVPKIPSSGSTETETVLLWILQAAVPFGLSRSCPGTRSSLVGISRAMF